MAQKTATSLWSHSADIDELPNAIGHGAAGVPGNPVTALGMPTKGPATRYAMSCFPTQTRAQLSTVQTSIKVRWLAVQPAATG
jgi:hypothetical protein